MGPGPHPPRTMRRVAVLRRRPDRQTFCHQSLLPQLSVVQCQDLLQIAIYSLIITAELNLIIE